jgi:hypothetical protein
MRSVGLVFVECCLERAWSLSGIKTYSDYNLFGLRKYYRGFHIHRAIPIHGMVSSTYHTVTMPIVRQLFTPIWFHYCFA